MEIIKKVKKNKTPVCKKKGDDGRETRRNAASVDAAYKNATKITNSARTTGITLFEDDLMDKTENMEDAAELLMERNDESSVNTKSSLGPEASGDNLKTALSNDEPLGKLPVKRDGKTVLPPVEASEYTETDGH